MTNAKTQIVILSKAKNLSICHCPRYFFNLFSFTFKISAFGYVIPEPRGLASAILQPPTSISTLSFSKTRSPVRTHFVERRWKNKRNFNKPQKVIRARFEYRLQACQNNGLTVDIIDFSAFVNRIIITWFFINYLAIIFYPIGNSAKINIFFISVEINIFTRGNGV